MSRFDKFFSNIQSKESRLYRRLQDLDDLIYDKYFNEFSGKTTFTAEVLSETNSVDAEGEGSNSTQYLPIRVRIDGIHTNQIPDPYKATKNLKGDEAIAKFRALLLSHPLAFPDTEIYSDSAVSQPLNRGDRIEVFFAIEGPQASGRQRGLRYGKVVAPAIARTVPAGANLSETFDEGIASTLGEGGGIDNPEELSNAPDLLRRTEELVVFLQEVGYHEKIHITSGYRKPSEQINAMYQNLFENGGAGPQFADTAKNWITETYRSTELKELVTGAIDASKKKSDFKQEFEAYVTANISSISPHSSKLAIDIQTQGIPYANVQIMKKGIQAATEAKKVYGFKWEYIDQSGFEEIKEARKTSLTSPTSEHIHVTFERQQGE